MTISRRVLTASLSAMSVAALVACGGGGSTDADGIRTALGDKGIKEGFSIPRVAGCRGPNDSPEEALQGQVPKAVRESADGFKGYNCNLELVGQLQGEGGNWSSAMFTDSAGRSCAYYATAAPTARIRFARPR